MTSIKDLIILFIIVASLIVPIMWFDGHGKSAYLKQTQGIDLPWYQVAFLEVKISTVKAIVKQEEQDDGDTQ